MTQLKNTNIHNYNSNFDFTEYPEGKNIDSRTSEDGEIFYGVNYLSKKFGIDIKKEEVAEKKTKFLFDGLTLKEYLKKNGKDSGFLEELKRLKAKESLKKILLRFNIKFLTVLNETYSLNSLCSMVYHDLDFAKQVEEVLKTKLGKNFNINEKNIARIDTINSTIKKIKKPSNSTEINSIELKYTRPIYLIIGEQEEFTLIKVSELGINNKYKTNFLLIQPKIFYKTNGLLGYLEIEECKDFEVGFFSPEFLFTEKGYNETGQKTINPLFNIKIDDGYVQIKKSSDKPIFLLQNSQSKYKFNPDLLKNSPLETTEINKKDTIIMVGDTHGSYIGFLANLKQAGIIEDDFIGDKEFLSEKDIEEILSKEVNFTIKKNIHIYLLGDILADRNIQSFYVIRLIEKLKIKLEKKSGELHILAGNHDGVAYSFLLGTKVYGFERSFIGLGTANQLLSQFKLDEFPGFREHKGYDIHLKMLEDSKFHDILYQISNFELLKSRKGILITHTELTDEMLLAISYYGEKNINNLFKNFLKNAILDKNLKISIEKLVEKTLNFLKNINYKNIKDDLIENILKVFNENGIDFEQSNLEFFISRLNKLSNEDYLKEDFVRQYLYECFFGNDIFLLMDIFLNTNNRKYTGKKGINYLENIGIEYLINGHTTSKGLVDLSQKLKAISCDNTAFKSNINNPYFDNRSVIKITNKKFIIFDILFTKREELEKSFKDLIGDSILGFLRRK